MEYRGHILIIFALMLVFSPWVLNRLAAHQETETAVMPTRLVTQDQARANCDAQSVETAIGRVGCTSHTQAPTTRRIDQTMRAENPNRRVQPSGAMFISAPER